MTTPIVSANQEIMIPGHMPNTKPFAVDMKMCADISRAYSEIFHDIRPLCTVVGTPALNRPTQFVEIMMEAVIGCGL